MNKSAEMTNEQATAYLMRHGNFAVPCSRYGSDTAECAEVAVAAARIFAEAQGEPLTPETLDFVMGLVVNDSDDPAHLIRNFGGADVAPLEGCAVCGTEDAGRIDPDRSLDVCIDCLYALNA